MKKIFFILFIGLNTHGFSQSFNDDKIPLANFIRRMYDNEHFNGVKIVEDYDNKFLISLVTLDKEKYPSPTTMNRVAEVKSRQQANTFLNGSTISSEMIIYTDETKKKDSTITSIKTTEIIKENSMGFVNGMALLINFETDEGKRMVFIYLKEIEK